MRTTLLSILIINFVLLGNAQTIGGNSIYNFLKLPATPQLTGLGGVNISNISNDIGLSFNNPALLRPSMHAQLTTVFNSMYAGIKNYHAMMGYTSEKLQTNFSLGTQYFDYGTIAQTDASGNVLGTFRPGDYVAQISGSRKYLERWYYGATIKFIHSNYGLYRSDGLAMDVGVAYYDSTSLLQVSVLMKNMGVQLKKYEGTNGDDLPFDIQAGITKRLKNAPLQFSLTAQHLHQFNIRYNDTSFNNDNGFNQTGKAPITLDKIFRHIVIATQVYVGDKLEITAAYNHLRRAELNIYNATNGSNGFSLGVGVLFKKIQIRYARAYYQNNTAYNQFGLNLSLNEFSAL
jgi:hypothetical protein